MLLRSLALVAAAGCAITAAETTVPAPATTPVSATATAGAAALSLRDKASYLVGTNMAEAVKQYELDPALVAQAILDITAGKPALVPKTEAQQVLGAYQAEMQAKKDKLSANRKGENDKFLAENAKKPGVTTTASGLQYEVLTAAKEGARKPTAADQVKVHYTGQLLSGEVFDASANHGGPATFGVGQVIKGWVEGLQLMGEGAKFKFTIPSALAYGEQAPPNIGPNQVLVFEVELLEVIPAK